MFTKIWLFSLVFIEDLDILEVDKKLVKPEFLDKGVEFVFVIESFFISGLLILQKDFLNVYTECLFMLGCCFE